MTSPRRVTLSTRIVVLVISTILFSCVTAYLEQPTETIETSGRARSSKEFKTLMGALRTSDKGGEVANKVSHEEDRGFLIDKLVSTPLLKVGLKFAMKTNDSPTKVLQDFRRLKVPMKDDYLLLWMGYVQKYRTKSGGGIWTDNTYVVKTLKEFMPFLKR